MLSKKDSLRRHIEDIETRVGVHIGKPTIIDFDRDDRLKIIKMLGYVRVKGIAIPDRTYGNDIDLHELSRSERLEWIRERGWKKASNKRKRKNVE
jgi:hypothetical protein